MIKASLIILSDMFSTERQTLRECHPILEVSSLLIPNTSKAESFFWEIKHGGNEYYLPKLFFCK